MNALWINRMAAYKQSPLALESAKQLIAKKIEQESALLARYKHKSFVADFSCAETMQDVLLIEARAAHHFWRAFAQLLPPSSGFVGRVPHAPDPVNQLLDIGFHHLMGIVDAYLKVRSVPTDLGLLHTARTTKSAPLVYDLVELFRADTVDAEVLRFFRLKKRPIRSADAEVAHFLHNLNKRLNRCYYLKDFRQCQTYRYYMELQMLRFISAVDHKAAFAPISLPRRHESRCLTHRTDVLYSEQPSVL